MLELHPLELDLTMLFEPCPPEPESMVWFELLPLKLDPTESLAASAGAVPDGVVGDMPTGTVLNGVG